MDKKEIDKLIEKYTSHGEVTSNIIEWNSSQFDDRSAHINYSMVRHFKPKVVVEFGSRTGRCTNDILKALIDNGGKYTFKSYELEDDLRKEAQKNINKRFKKNAIKIGGNIIEATDIPDNIEYLFVDNYHDTVTTEWLFNTLIKKCVPGALVQIHDIPLKGDFEIAKPGVFDETNLIVSMHHSGTLPLEKLYWIAEEGEGYESSWWIYKP
jgi:predicted O-methyltransferase YrrM